MRYSFLLCAILFVVACSEKEQVKSVAAPVEMRVITLKDSSIPITSEYVGQTKGAVDADVRARVEGVITALHFDEGKEVKEGQLLYTIDPAPFQAKLSEAKAKLAEAQTRLVKAQADLRRVRPLAAMKAVSARDLDTAIAQEGVAKGGVDAAQAGVESAQIDLGYTKILAPITGMIGLTKAKVGEFVGKPPNVVVLNTVSQLDPIHVRFTVSEKDYLYFARLRQKREAAGEGAIKRVLKLILSDGSEYGQDGELASVDSQIDPATGALTVEASFPNPGKILRPGQFAKVSTTRETLQGIVISKKAIRDLQGIRQVLVVVPGEGEADSTVDFRTITIKQEVGDLVLVDTGLTVGEKIIPELQQRLLPGTKIKPVEVEK